MCLRSVFRPRPRMSLLTLAFCFYFAPQVSLTPGTRALAGPIPLPAPASTTSETGGTADPTDGQSFDPPPLQANFKVFQLVSVDPLDGSEEWVEIDLASEQVELGLRVKFDGTYSSGPVGWTFWDFMDSTGGSDPVELHAFAEPGDYDVTLTVYSEDWTEWDTVSKTVHVAEGFQWRSTMPPPSEPFHPARIARRECELWSISVLGHLGVADISNPYDLPALEIMPVGPFDTNTYLALSESQPGQEKLYVAKGTNGVDVYRADPGDFTLLAHLSSAELGASWARRVNAIGDIMYVGTDLPGQILTYHVPSGAPTLLDVLPLPGGLTSMGQVEDEALIVLDGDGPVTIVDLRTPMSPRIGPSLGFGVNLSDRIQTCGHLVGLAGAQGTVLFELIVPEDPGEPIAVGPHRVVEPCSTTFALGPGRVYVRGSYSLYKHDIVALDAYLMEELDTQASMALPFFLFDPDGPEGQDFGEFLIAGTNVDGFSSFSVDPQ